MSTDARGPRPASAKRWAALGTAALVVALLPGCAPDGGGAPDPTDEASTGGEASAAVGADPAATADQDTSTPERAALPTLFRIMAGLERDMARVDAGLWRGEMDSVAVAAEAVAGHPAIPPEEAERIRATLGEAMAGFAAYDGEVHDLAARLAELARAGDVPGVLATGAELRAGCVGCHDAFRERLRSGLR